MPSHKKQSCVQQGCHPIKVRTVSSSYRLHADPYEDWMYSRAPVSTDWMYSRAPVSTDWMYSRAPVSTDSVSAVYLGNWKIKEIRGSLVSKRAPSDNGP
jgi:hypothetical protein